MLVLELPISTVLLNGPGYLQTRLLTVVFNHTGLKKDVLPSHGAFFLYVCDIVLLRCCNEEQRERLVQVKDSRNSADLRPVSKGINLSS